ncbi:MAG TPA: ADP-glyceromanno-heptose 6-epimerase [Phnomibacter sp.]|nr:ADP-glyceromanno-heptose 6-epimerase [Phnomibacter sp.]
MKKASTIVLTGAAGFIGSALAGYLNELGYTDLVLVDDFGVEAKRPNWQHKQYAHVVERQSLEQWLNEWGDEVGHVIHLGARTDTTEFDYSVHQVLNVEYSQMLWNFCTQKQVPFIYASSAATYGAGELGYDDDHEKPFLLNPLNPYGVSKNEFDKWALEQSTGLREDILDEDGWVRDDGAHTPDPAGGPPFWAGLKFFNVYGPNEYHKGRMASVIWHSFNQIKANGQVKLFRSHRSDFEDGQQLRDFVYVKDVVKVIGWIFENSKGENSKFQKEWKRFSGLYNLGTGKARSFYDLAAATFRGMDLEPNIVFIDMPEDIRDKYQYFTEANMGKLRQAGYDAPFTTLEEGVDDYVRHYLRSGNYL